MKKSMISLLAAVCLALASCGPDESPINTATYKFHGTVTSFDLGPAQGIRVVFASSENLHAAVLDTVYTESDGYYYMQRQHIAATSAYYIYFSDVDGATNGGPYKTEVKEVVLTRDDFQGGDGKSFYGTVDKTVDALLVYPD